MTRRRTRPLRPLLLLLLVAACSSVPIATTTTPPVAASASESAAPSPTASATPTAAAATQSPASTGAGPLAWTELGSPGPAAREDHTWTVDEAGETAYLFGGRDGATVYADLWAYDLATDSWSEATVAGGPAGRFGHEAVWADGIGLVIFAGQVGTTFFNDLWAFDPATSEWRELPAGGAVPVARYGTCSGIGPDGRLWISHGFTSDGTRFADTLAYDFETAEWTDETPDAPLPVNRCLHGCWWTDDGSLALYGGQTMGVTAIGDLWLLGDGAWSSLEGELPAHRNLFAHARVPGAALVFGGQAVKGSYLADLYEFSDGLPVPEPLDPEGVAPAARAGAAMVVDAAGGRVLLFGGRDADGAFGDTWALTGLDLGG